MRTGLARAVAIAMLVGGMIGLPAASVAAAPAGSGAPMPASAASRPTAPGAHGLSTHGALPAVTAGYNWVDGVINQNATFLYGNYITGWLVGYDSAYVGYYPYTDSGGYPTGAFPQVGDVYYMHVVVAVVGNPGSGGDIAHILVALPDNTELAISASNPTACYFIGPSVTQTTCPDPGIGTTDLPIDLGTVPVASYYMFEEQFPVVSTAPLDGISNPESYLGNGNTWAIGEFDSGVQLYDWEPIWVPPVAVDTTITSKPASSTSSTSATFAFTSNLGGSSFKCRLDSGSWAACSSPKSYSGLAKGSHTFRVAAVDGMGRADPTPASYTWTVVAAPGPATHLAVGTFNPYPAGSGHSVTVKALDASGNVATGYRGTIHFTSSDTRATLPADYTFTGTDSGVHTFSYTLNPKLVLKTAGSQWVRATDKTKASITGSQTVTVTPGTATHLSVGTMNPYPAGSAHSVTVTARDAYGNIATGYRGTVHFTSSDTKATVPADYTFKASDKGAHTFAYTLNPKLVLKTAGSQWVRATDKSTASITGSQTVTVSPGAATHLSVGTNNPFVAGSAHSVTVKALDAYGNVATGYTGTIHFTSSDTKATVPADYTFKASDKGAHTFAYTLNPKLVLKTVGSQWVRATDKTTASITGSQTVTVT